MVDRTADQGRLPRPRRSRLTRPINPLTQGFICKKVKHHHERVVQPAPRAHAARPHGPQGVGRVPRRPAGTRPSTWSRPRSAHALADDPATVVPYLYNSSAGALSAGAARAPCSGASSVPARCTTRSARPPPARRGSSPSASMPGADLLDVVHAQLVVVWGANPAISNTHFPPLVNQARAAGAAAGRGRSRAAPPWPAAPTCTWPSAPGHRRRAGHGRGRRARPARPGRPCLHRRARRRRRRVPRRPAVAWTLDEAAATCGLTVDEIVAFVDLLATRRPAFWRPGWGLERNRNGGSAMRAVLALPVLTGAFGRLGSGVHLHTGHDIDWDKGSAARGRARDRRRRIPMRSRRGPAVGARSTRTSSARC